MGDWGEAPSAPVAMGEALPPYQPSYPPPHDPAPEYHQPYSPPPAPVQEYYPATPERAPRRAPAKATARPAEQPANKNGLMILAGILVLGGALGFGVFFFLISDDSDPEPARRPIAKKEGADDQTPPDDTGNVTPTPEPVVKPDPLPEAALAERTPQEIYDNSLLVLKSGTLPNRIIAAQRLGNLKAEAQAAVPALIAALDKPDQQLQAAVGTALVQIGPPKPGTGVERMLLPALRSKSPQARTYAAKLLAAEPTLNVESAKPLVAALSDELPEIRVSCIQAIGKIGPKAQAAAFEPILDRVVDPDEAVREAAVAAIPTLGPPIASLRPGLVTRLKHNDARMRSTAAPLLASLGTKGDDTLKIWQPLLKDSDPKLRLIALTALSSSMELVIAAGNDIVPLLADQDAAVRKAAAQSAIHLGKTIGASIAIARGFTTETDPAVKLVLAEALVTLAKPDLSNLGAFRLVLKESSPTLREQAAQKLTTIGADAQDALPELTTCIEDESPTVRVAALKAMAAMGSDCKAALPMVAGLFGKEQVPTPVLVAAVEVLGAGGMAGVPHLEALLKKPVPVEVKEQLCVAFSQNKILSEAVQLWLVDQSETLTKSREVIAKTLASKGKDAAVELLLQRTHLYKAAKGANPPEMYPVEYRQWVLSVLSKMDLQLTTTRETRTKVTDRMKYLSRNDKAPEIVAGANAVLKNLN